VIVPAGSGLAEVVDDRFGRTFDPAAGTTALADALLEAPELISESARAAATATAADLSPKVVARRFATSLRERLDRAAIPTA
jgi:hypothetical protein